MSVVLLYYILGLWNARPWDDSSSEMCPWEIWVQDSVSFRQDTYQPWPIVETAIGKQMSRFLFFSFFFNKQSRILDKSGN